MVRERCHLIMNRQHVAPYIDTPFFLRFPISNDETHGQQQQQQKLKRSLLMFSFLRKHFLIERLNRFSGNIVGFKLNHPMNHSANLCFLIDLMVTLKIKLFTVGGI